MKLINIVGARPQFIKIAPVLKAIDAANALSSGGIDDVLVHSGQHYDREMSEIFFDQLQIKQPDYNLGVGSGTQAEQTGEMLKRIERVLLDEKPDWVVVYGDTNTTIAGALAATKLHIPVAHVEAGLRSFNRSMPEEINRILTDHIASLLFCPTELAVKYLKSEGITEGVFNVGDVMYDSVLHFSEIAEQTSRVLEAHSLVPREFILATCHRAENTDDTSRIQGILEALDEIAEDVRVILPIHPRTRIKMEELGMSLKHVTTIEPLSFLDMMLLEKNAKCILTDSGGVQKEAFIFRVPCVTLRNDTEWDETVEAGWNQLVGASKEKILQAARSATAGHTEPDFLGDGHAAEYIVKQLLFTTNKEKLA